jgi:hypothetical protein
MAPRDGVTAVPGSEIFGQHSIEREIIMSIRALLFTPGLLCLLAAFPAIVKGGEAPKQGLPEAARKILSGATRVECFRIDPRTSDSGDEKPGGKAIDGYPITATAKEQGRAFAGKLVDALNDEKSYGPPARCFFPGVGLRVWKGKESLDVIICFSCSNFYVVARDEDGKEVARTAQAGFDAAITSWVKLARQAFPDDAAIQKLDAKDGRGDERKPGL